MSFQASVDLSISFYWGVSSDANLRTGSEHDGEFEKIIARDVLILLEVTSKFLQFLLALYCNKLGR